MRHVLRCVYERGEEPGDALTASDSLSALRRLEQVWRAGKWRAQRGRNAAMLEAACAVRAALQRHACSNIHMWCPGHTLPFNSMADAEAKASLGKPMHDVPSWVARAVTSRPYVYVRHNEGARTLRNGAVRSEAIETSAGWVRQRMYCDMPQIVGVWEAVVVCTAEATI